ncbi:MAG: efflux RND transporter periplasmic adaptor subunit [Pseudomonadota bacterium]
MGRAVESMRKASLGRLLKRAPVVAMASAIIILLAAAGCEKRDQSAEPPKTAPIDVTVVTVTPRDVPVSFEFIAQTQSSRQVNIQARVSGFLDKRIYTEGETVKEGQVLFQMDKKPFQVQLNQQLAALAMQQAALETARSNLARVKPLARLKALSQKDLDEATGQFQSAEAAVAQAQAEVESARLNLSYTTITSPVAGITSAANQADGTYLNQENSLLTTVAVLSPMWVNFSLSENAREKFRMEVEKGLLRTPKDLNFEIEIVLIDGRIFPHKGTITFAEPSYSAETGTFLIRASVDNPEGELHPNQYVRARLNGAVRPEAVLLPQRAVMQGAKGHFVWVIDKNNQADLRPVTVGEWYQDEWFIDEGLQKGERVAVDGTLLLRPDAPVRVTMKVDAPEQHVAPKGN